MGGRCRFQKSVEHDSTLNKKRRDFDMSEDDSNLKDPF